MGRSPAIWIATVCLLGVAIMHDTETARGAGELPDFNKLWNYGNPAETEQRFRELLPIAEASGNLNYLLQLETQIARTLGLQRKFDEAHAVLDLIETRLTEDPSLAVAGIRYRLERGRTWNSSGHPEFAKPLWTEAWDSSREAGQDNYAVDAAHMMAIVSTGNEAAAWFEKGVALAEASDDPKVRGWLGPLLNNLGWTYHDAGEYEEALAVFEKALAWRRENSEGDTVRIARWSVARCLRSLGRIDQAYAIQTELWTELEVSGASDGFVNEELGECLLLMGREKEAMAQFSKAYALLSEDAWFVANEPDRLERLRTLGHGSPEPGQ